MIAYLIHGFNVSNVNGGLAALIPYLESEGFTPVTVNYGWFGLGRVRFCNRGVALALASVIREPSVGIGHSNGCAILQRASLSGAAFDKLCFINPALGRKAEIGPQVRKIHVWHSPSDVPVKIARYLVAHAWGDMGAAGYRGSDPRFVNFDKENGWAAARSKSHSDVFDPGKIEFFGPKIASALRHEGGKP